MTQKTLPPLTLEEMKREIKALAERGEHSPDRGARAVAAVLCGLLGAIYEHKVMEFLDHVCIWSQGAVRRLGARRN